MPLAPHEIVSIFGAGLGPTTPVVGQPIGGAYSDQLGGVQITFDGVAAPLLYASTGQVNLVTPGSLEGKSTTEVCAVVNSVSTNCLTVPVQPAAPGIFGSGVLDGGYLPYAAAVNQDGTVNSQQNPAAAGSIVSLFVTGLGSVTPSVPDGGTTPLPIPSPDLSIGIDTCQLLSPDSCAVSEFFQALYAGPAPLEVEGLGQINVRLPSGPGQILFTIEVNFDGTSARSYSAAIWTH
jgi:uncharacterized protein (TIGR03437 family)